ncbi:MAG: MFS transporter [Promethearchaeota archaeon]
MENIVHSKSSMASYGCAKALNEFFNMAFMAFGFFFYETEIGLNVWYVGLGFIIFAIWNAINDPLVGYLTDRPFKFTRKLGRRFPWIMLGGTCWIFSYILIFIPPNVNPKSGAWIIFSWLVAATCLYDLFASIFFVNFAALFPDKFRSVEERRKVNAIATPIGILGIVTGGIVPPLFIEFGNTTSYIIQAGMMIIIALIILALSIPGCRDEKVIVERYLTTFETRKVEEESFFKSLRVAMKQKSFVYFILAYLCYQTTTTLMQTSVSYVIRFILRLPATSMIFIMLALLVGAVISIPIWIYLANKTNDNRKIIMTAGALMVIATAPLIFLDNYIAIIIAMFLWGLCFGGYWVMLAPVLADVIDESVVRTGKREEGVYNGFQQFFGRLSFLFSALSIAIVHTLTGFKEGAKPEAQTTLAIIGIHIHFGLIPMLFMIVSVFLLWKGYDLVPEKVKANQEKIKEMGL